MPASDVLDVPWVLMPYPPGYKAPHRGKKSCTSGNALSVIVSDRDARGQQRPDLFAASFHRLLRSLFLTIKRKDIEKVN